MTLMSMTGFARASGATGAFRFAWEIRSVNARGLDLRVRVPPGFDAIEAQARAALAKSMARGTCNATLNVQRDAAPPQTRVNVAALNGLIAALAEVPANPAIAPASLDGLLGVRGIVETFEPREDEGALALAQAATLAALEEAIAGLNAMRAGEGAALGLVLAERVARIGELSQAADDCPARKPEAVRAKLAQSIAALVGASPALDPHRLHQEAVLIAARGDIREEIDRLQAHVAAVSALLRDGGPVGRKLDFLAQELAREANTLSAKSSDSSLSAIGLELKVLVEQLREQVQNIE